MQKEKIVYQAVDDLIPYVNNPRNNDAAVDAVANSIEEFGFKVPVVVDEDNIIVAGHTRIKAAGKLGMDEVPTIIARNLTDDQIKAFRLADNRTGELAEWDFDGLVAELDDVNMNMEAFGFGENLEDVDLSGVFEDYYSDDEGNDSDESSLKWEDKRVALDDNDIEILDNLYYKWMDASNGQSFVSFILRGT